MVNNVKTDSGMERYKSTMFTEKGYGTLLNYCQNLGKAYHERKKYPFKLGIVFGIPQMKFAQLVESKEMLLERMVAYAHLLGIDMLEVKLSNGSEVLMSFTTEEGDD